ncbi:MAG: DUF6122 family protein [Thermodesulfobacteriota bacterium]
MLRGSVHIALHLFLPAAAARLGFTDRWKRAWGIMLAAMIVDLDHLAAVPVFDPNRCSIGFHPLHSGSAILIYLLMTALPKTRIVAVGLLIHMAVDAVDCFWIKLIY